MRLAGLVAFSFAMVGILSLGVGAARADAPALVAPLTGPSVGAAAPPFSLRTLDGKTVSLASYAGKTLVINVWATWCPPCRHEMPDLIATAPRLRAGGVAFLGVDTTETPAVLRTYVAARGVPYPQAIESPGGAFSKAYDVQYFPTTFVIDPQGILRARYVANVTAAQLVSFTADARAGRNVDVATAPLQKKIDALLTDPTFAFGGDAAAVEANAKRAQRAIAQAEKILDDDTPDGDAPDLVRTRGEEAVLRDAAIAALAGLTAAPADATLLPRLRGDAALDREQWVDAIAGYQAVLAIDPKNEDVLGNVELAALRTHRYDLAIDADTKLAALEPADVGTLVALALDERRAGKKADSLASFDRALAVAKQQVDAKPGQAYPVRMLAYAHLYAGRTYAAFGDPAPAREQFSQTLAWARKLPPGDKRHDMYIEEAQEAAVALALGSPGEWSTVSVVPWTGADLPGSIPNTIKYRLVVAGAAGKTVDLRATAVPKGWVASFCSDRVCAPFAVTLAIPDSGVKVVEFQLVPPSPGQDPPRVRIVDTDGAHESSAST
jgi:peroxiredoxin